MKKLILLTTLSMIFFSCALEAQTTDVSFRVEADKPSMIFNYLDASDGFSNINFRNGNSSEWALFHHRFPNGSPTNNLTLWSYKASGDNRYVMHFIENGNVGIGGILNPKAKLEVYKQMRVRLNNNATTKNVVSLVDIGASGGTGARNWALRGVYQYSNGVSYNSAGGDLDIIKSWNRNTILATKTDGTSLGNVGIGIISPTEKLHVDGVIKLKDDWNLVPNGSGIFSIKESGFGGAFNIHKNGAQNNNLLNLVEGKVGIGTINPDAALTVAGQVHCQELLIEADAGADFVFADDYELTDLNVLKEFVTTNKHLPEIASEADMIEDGVDMGKFQIQLLQKVEELTLYTIDQEEQIEKQNALINSLVERLEAIETK